MGIFSFKHRAPKEEVSDILYETIFRVRADEMWEYARQRLVDRSLPLDSSKQHEIKLECFSLTAVFFSFSFQKECDYLGQDTIKALLDGFYSKLYEELNGLVEPRKVYELLGPRYDEYKSLMKEDLYWIEQGTPILFLGTTEAFFSRVCPHHLRSPELVAFGPFLSEVHLSFCRALKTVKDFKIRSSDDCSWGHETSS